MTILAYQCVVSFTGQFDEAGLYHVAMMMCQYLSVQRTAHCCRLSNGLLSIYSNIIPYAVQSHIYK